MELKPEDENLVKARKFIDDELLPLLRHYFKRKWNAKRNPNESYWSDSPDDGKVLVKERKGPRLDKNVSDKLKSGKTDEWDATCLFDAIMAVVTKQENAEEFKSISALRKQRNKVFHKEKHRLSCNETERFYRKIETSFRSLGFPKDAINKYTSDCIITPMMKELTGRLESEKRKALKEDQVNLCNLQKEMENFVGREKEINESKRILLHSEKFLKITGGPCYGKSSLANELGHALFGKPFNYVIGISMRDITSSPLTLEDVAQNILMGFQIDTTEMQNEIVNFLIRKLESITSGGKKALLIFDNADNLIGKQGDKTCQSTTYEKLCKIIRSNSRESSICCIFTTRVCNKLEQDEDDHYIIKLDKISDEESEEYIHLELEDVAGFDLEKDVEELVSISYGLPMALQLVCSTIKNLGDKELIGGYINNLKKDTFGTVAKDSRLERLLALSLNYLDESDKELLLFLAAFPSRFSYAYTKELISVAKRDEKNIEIRLQKLEDHSLIQDDSRNHGGSDHDFLTRKIYIMHPFLCQYIREDHWADKMYENSYYMLYIQKLFSLAGRAIEKDNYVNCLREFQAEQHNHFDVMAQIGKSSEQVNQSSHLQETFHKELERMTTPDHIAIYLFCVDMASPSLLHKYFEGCMALVNEGIKKDIWCCLYDLNMKCYEKKIDDSSNELEPGNYGRALLDKRNISTKLHNSYMNKTTRDDFQEILNEIKVLEDRAEALECMKMKAYFKHKALKSKGDWLKKGLKIRSLHITRDECIDAYTRALKICEENFGDSWLTIDCHNQLGKFYWSLKENEEATQQFDNAIELAESMSLTKNKKFGSCLLDKGRFLIASRDKKNIEEGKDLLEDFITRCKDVTDTTLWWKAMQSLCIADKSYFGLAKEKFFQMEELNSSAMHVMEGAIELDSQLLDKSMDEEKLWDCRKSMANELIKAIEHLEIMLESSSKDYDNNNNENNNTFVVNDAKNHLFYWQKRAALCYPYVLPLDKRKEFAEKALRFIESSSTRIRKHEKEDLQSVVSETRDPEEKELLQTMHYMTVVAKSTPQEGKDDELLQRCSKLLQKYELNQEIWSFLALKISKRYPVFYDGVICFLVHQSEPCKELLELVYCKFYHEIRIYDREADEKVIVEESLKAVDDLEKAIEHVQKLLEKESLLSSNVSTRLKENLYKWYKNIAWHVGYLLPYEKHAWYAKEALEYCTSLKVEQIKHFKTIKKQEITEEEREKVAQRLLLVKVTHFMRQNGLQDELERRYDTLLDNCSSYPRIRFDMIKFIIEKRHVENSKFTKYLSYLPQHFQDKSLSGSWDYQSFINLANNIFSEKVDLPSREKNFQIYYSIYEALCSLPMPQHPRIKLVFDFLYAFSLKIGNDIIDDKKKLQHAQHALELFDHVGEEQKKDKDLLKCKEKLEDYLAKNKE